MEIAFLFIFFILNVNIDYSAEIKYLSSIFLISAFFIRSFTFPFLFNQLYFLKGLNFVEISMWMLSFWLTRLLFYFTLIATSLDELNLNNLIEVETILQALSLVSIYGAFKILKKIENKSLAGLLISIHPVILIFPYLDISYISEITIVYFIIQVIIYILNESVLIRKYQEITWLNSHFYFPGLNAFYLILLQYLFYQDRQYALLAILSITWLSIVASCVKIKENSTNLLNESKV